VAGCVAAKDVSRIAGEDLSRAKYLAVTARPDGSVVIAQGTERVLGIVSHGAERGRAAAIGIGGRLLILLGADAGPGAALQAGAGGRAIPQGGGAQIGLCVEGGRAGAVVGIDWKE
jgi:hypothetical protein